MKVWQGRFDKETDKQVEEFTSSLAQDLRLYQEDIRGSIAHVKMLAKQNIITNEDANSIVDGLGEIKEEISKGAFEFLSSDEDVHTAIERALIEKKGEVGGKMHTARSRNDQVATDMRLYIKNEIEKIKKLTRELQQVIVGIAKDNKETIMPGFTHLQKAQPVLFAHYIMAYFWMLERDYKRLNCAFKQTDILPLGSGAMAGTTFNTDRQFLADELGFANVSQNSMDSVSDRDYQLTLLNAANIIMLHLSRLAEELVIFSNEEFSYIQMDEGFTTGSSIMPQKQNPDVAEIVRGKSGRVAGNYQALSMIVKGLPLTYNRDLQEDKRLVFDSIDTVKSSLSIMAKLLKTTKINKKRMLESAQNSFANATDLADYLVEKGVPFREAHGIVGSIVKKCIKEGYYLSDLGLKEYRKVSPVFNEDLYSAIMLKNVISRHNSFGGTSYNQVERQIKEAEKIAST